MAFFLRTTSGLEQIGIQTLIWNKKEGYSVRAKKDILGEVFSLIMTLHAEQRGLS